VRNVHFICFHFQVFWGCVISWLLWIYRKYDLYDVVCIQSLLDRKCTESVTLTCLIIERGCFVLQGWHCADSSFENYGPWGWVVWWPVYQNHSWRWGATIRETIFCVSMGHFQECVSQEPLLQKSWNILDSFVTKCQLIKSIKFWKSKSLGGVSGRPTIGKITFTCHYVGRIFKNHLLKICYARKLQIYLKAPTWLCRIKFVKIRYVRPIEGGSYWVGMATINEYNLNDIFQIIASRTVFVLFW
jgi:hypothetical protein